MEKSRPCRPPHPPRQPACARLFSFAEKEQRWEQTRRPPHPPRLPACVCARSKRLIGGGKEVPGEGLLAAMRPNPSSEAQGEDKAWL